jgi:hypothetical protein
MIHKEIIALMKIKARPATRTAILLAVALCGYRGRFHTRVFDDAHLSRF